MLFINFASGIDSYINLMQNQVHTIFISISPVISAIFKVLWTIAAFRVFMRA